MKYDVRRLPTAVETVIKLTDKLMRFLRNKQTSATEIKSLVNSLNL